MTPEKVGWFIVEKEIEPTEGAVAAEGSFARALPAPERTIVYRGPKGTVRILLHPDTSGESIVEADTSASEVVSKALGRQGR